MKKKENQIKSNRGLRGDGATATPRAGVSLGAFNYNSDDILLIQCTLKRWPLQILIDGGFQREGANFFSFSSETQLTAVHLVHA